MSYLNYRKSILALACLTTFSPLVVWATIPEGTASGNSAFAIGGESTVNGNFSFAIGPGAHVGWNIDGEQGGTTSHSSVALGGGARILEGMNGSTALGAQTTVKVGGGVAAGLNSVALRGANSTGVSFTQGG